LRNANYSELSRSLFKRFGSLNRLSYRVWRGFLEHGFGKAVIAPGWQRNIISAMCRANLRFVIKDPQLREKLTPDHQPMCRRLIMSSRFYPAMQEPAVELVTDAIERIVPEGVMTADGRVHEADVLVLATGFDPQAFMRPMELVGEGGVTIGEAWADGPVAYRTVAMPGFPNFFMLMGPHSPFGNQSLVLVAETQADYVVWWIEQLRAGRAVAGSPTAEATDRYNAEMKEAMPNTVWMTGCKSWYLGKDGLPQLWPWTPAAHREMLAAPVFEEFALSGSSVD
jgi:cation diffusion facilitator CzcD-associated flavoprotein CzcO